MVLKILDFLTKYAVGITVVITLSTGAFKFWQFVNVQKADSRQREYENYHNLIEKLVVDRKEIDGWPFIDVQIASVYELRNFPRYFPVTATILGRLKNRIKDVPTQNDLVSEIENTIKFTRRWHIF